jgi:spermidine synthase
MVSIRITEEVGIRYLQFGPGWIQGAMRVSRPTSLVLDYTREMMLPLLLRRSAGWPRSVLQVGLGAGSFTRFLHAARPKSDLVVAEIAPLVALTAWEFFELPPESARLQIEITDGYRYMATTRRKFDLILVDGFDADVRAGDLESTAFYRLCRKRLTDSGMMAVNLLGKKRDKKPRIERLEKVFDDRVLALPPCGENTVVIAANGSPVHARFETLRGAAENFRSKTGLNLLPTVKKAFRARGGCREDLLL